MIKLLLVFLSWSASPADSLRIETVNGKQFIIHQIDGKETLYSISKRYGVTVASIVENNPGADGGISIGKLLKVPYLPKTTANPIHIVAQKETLYSISRQYDVSVEDLKKINNLKDNDLSLGQELTIPKKTTLAEVPKLAEAPKPTEIKSLSGVHTVAAKETMYSISRQYGITVQQLKEWNNLQDELPIGKMLVVTQPKYMTQQNQSESVPKTPVENPAVINTTPIKISEQIIGTDEIKEQGMAELMEGTDGNRKYLALHRTIKRGTILKVRCETNNQEVFVRVNGPLPVTVSDGTILQISKSAYNRLGATDPKVRIELTYYK